MPCPEGNGVYSMTRWQVVNSLLAIPLRQTLQSLVNAQVQEPTLVRCALDRIRVGVIAAGRRAAGSSSSLPPISPQDLLMGTCIRFDTQERNALGASELQQVNYRHGRVYSATSHACCAPRLGVD